jgi:lipid-binding SYLF domain-containing protein
MAKYKLPNTQKELTDPFIESVNASFQIGAEKVSIIIVLRELENEQKFILIQEMENTETWSDDDVQSFVQKRLETFKVTNN